MRPTILSAVLPQPPHAGLPPPPLNVELVDAGRAVGWIADARVGFRGFSSDVEAAHAAWIAWRALQRRAARRLGLPPVPVDAEPLTLRRLDGRETILAGARPIGILLRPGTDMRTGPDSFAFELQLHASTDEVGLRAEAYIVYRALRRSVGRWALWRPDVTRPRPAVTERSPQPDASKPRRTLRTGTSATTSDRAAATPRRHDDDGAQTTRSVPRLITLRARVTFTAIAIVAGVTLLATVPPVLVAPLAFFLLSPFLAVRWLVRLNKRNAGRHALRKAGSAAHDPTATRPDSAPRELRARGTSGPDQKWPARRTRHATFRWNRLVTPRRAFRGQRAVLRGPGVAWASLAMLGSTMGAMALLRVDAKKITLAVASGGAVACMGVNSLRLSAKREGWTGVPPRVGFAWAARLRRTAPSDGLGYRTRRALPEEEIS